MEEKWSISWDKYHKNICTGLGALQQNGEFVDMTIAADGHHVQVHQIVMSLVSPYIKEIITSAKCPHPVIFLNKVSHQTMQAILEFAYTGQVVVEENKIREFLEACNDLQIRGLENMTSNWMEDTYKPNRKRKKPHPKVTYEQEIVQFIDDDNCVETDIHYDEEAIEETLDEEDSIAVKELAKDTGNKKDPISLEHDSNIDLMKLTSTLKYSVSQHGNIQMLLHGYLYSLIHVRKNKLWFWRCVNQQKMGCIAYVKTDGDLVKEKGSVHNHAPHDTQIRKRIKNDNVFTNIKDMRDKLFNNQRKRTHLIKQVLNVI